MKKLNLIRLVLIFVLIHPHNNALGQFSTAAIFENPCSVSVTPTNTGNDIYYYSGTSTVYKVSVYNDGGGAAGISWEVGINTGTAQFSTSTNIVHADVCIVEDAFNSTVDAIVAWYAAGGGNSYYVEDFQWSGSAFVSQGSVLLLTANFGCTLNIDGAQDGKGSFVIIFDTDNQGGSGYSDIYAITGQMDPSVGGMLPTNSWNLVQLTNLGGSPNNYRCPDAAFYSGTNTYPTVHFTYVDDPAANSPNYLYVQDILWSDLSNGTTAYITNAISAQAAPDFYYNPSPPPPSKPYYLQNPRIACPDNTGYDNDWTVVVEENQHSPNFYILGYNLNGGTPSGFIYYNDGTGNSPLDLTSVNNYLPVVTYDDYGQNNVWVGWNFDNSAPLTITGSRALMPIVFKCNYSAAVPSTNYWQVPYSLSPGDAVDLLSLSGRFTNDELWLTYYNVASSSDIYTKSAIPSSATTQLRSLPVAEVNEMLHDFKNISYEGYHNNSRLTIHIFDLMGNEVWKETGTLNQIQASLQESNRALSSSLYLVQLTSDDGKCNVSRKIFNNY